MGDNRHSIIMTAVKARYYRMHILLIFLYKVGIGGLNMAYFLTTIEIKCEQEM